MSPTLNRYTRTMELLEKYGIIVDKKGKKTTYKYGILRLTVHRDDLGTVRLITGFNKKST